MTKILKQDCFAIWIGPTLIRVRPITVNSVRALTDGAGGWDCDFKGRPCGTVSALIPFLWNVLFGLFCLAILSLDNWKCWNSECRNEVCLHHTSKFTEKSRIENLEIAADLDWQHRWETGKYWIVVRRKSHFAPPLLILDNTFRWRWNGVSRLCRRTSWQSLRTLRRVTSSGAVRCELGAGIVGRP